MVADVGLSEFIDHFLNTLSAEGPRLEGKLLAKKICDEFWYSKKTTECSILPWSLFASTSPRLVKVLNTTEESGFLGFVASSPQARGAQFLFSFLKENGEWRLDYFNRDIMRAYTAHWHERRMEAGTLRFYLSPSDRQSSFALKAVSEAHKWVSSSLESDPIQNLDYYFGVVAALMKDLFDEESPASGRFTGETNAGFLLFGGHIPEADEANANAQQMFTRSVVVHEMVHEYTWYSPDWSYNPGALSVAQPLLSEGMATFFEMKFLSTGSGLVEDSLERENLEGFRKGLLGAQAFNGKILDLLDGNKFRGIEQRTAYQLGACLIHALESKLGTTRMKAFWKGLEGSSDLLRVRTLILEKVSEEEINLSSKIYLTGVQATLDRYHGSNEKHPRSN